MRKEAASSPSGSQRPFWARSRSHSSDHDRAWRSMPGEDGQVPIAIDIDNLISRARLGDAEHYRGSIRIDEIRTTRNEAITPDLRVRIPLEPLELVRSFHPRDPV